MGIVGNLNDMTLVEFLQTIAMSRKSGVLEIHAGKDAAWLGVREGAVVRVALSARDLSREALLAEAGLEEKLPAGELESCLWDAALAALLGLLSWKEGEFTFEQHPDPDSAWTGPDGLQLPSALSPEFLALEGARRADQGDFAASLGEPATAAPAVAENRPLIAVDPDLRLLEAVKQALQTDSLAVHIFQHPDDALLRVKQYFQKGTVPTLLIGDGSLAKDQGLRAGWHTLVKGARRMVPAVRVILLRNNPGRPSKLADQEIERCAPRHGNEQAFAAFLERLAVALGAHA